MTGAELRARRERLGLTQAELAEAFAIHPNTVTKWEGGAPMRHPLVLRFALERLAEDKPAFGGDETAFKAHVARWHADGWAPPKR